MTPWLLLIYSVPREPSASRVFVRRRLLRLGAVAAQDAAWVLPATPAMREQMQWLAAEIKEMGGTAALWEAAGLLAGQDKQWRAQFAAASDAAYRAILLDLKKKGADVAALSRRYQSALAQDHFASKLGKQAREALLAAQEGRKS